MAAKQQQEKPKPEKKYRIGFLNATVWLNQHGEREFRTVDIARTFKSDKTPSGYDSNSTFTLSDLPQLAELVRVVTNHVAEAEADVSQ